MRIGRENLCGIFRNPNLSFSCKRVSTIGGIRQTSGSSSSVFSWFVGSMLKPRRSYHSSVATDRLRSGDYEHENASPSNGTGFATEASYTVSHRECGQFRSYVHENFEKFKIISTSTGSWIRSRRRDRIQLPDEVEIILNFSKFSWTWKRNYPHSRWDTV